MPMYDYIAEDGCQLIDVWEPIGSTVIHRCDHDLTMRRAWVSKPPAVIGDDIPGGVEIKHGLCNRDGTPHRYYSKSEMAKEAKKRGLENYVVHQPEKGSDRSKNTQRWV